MPKSTKSKDGGQSTKSKDKNNDKSVKNIPIPKDTCPDQNTDKILDRPTQPPSDGSAETVTLPIAMPLPNLPPAPSDTNYSKTSTKCNTKFDALDPHETCVRHTTSCIINYLYNPINCKFCQILLEKVKRKISRYPAIFQSRLQRMVRSFNTNNEAGRVPTHAQLHFGHTGDIFAPAAKYLDPRPRAQSKSPTPSRHQASPTPSAAPSRPSPKSRATPESRPVSPMSIHDILPSDHDTGVISEQGNASPPCTHVLTLLQHFPLLL